MFGKCKHSWVEKSKTFCPPARDFELESVRGPGALTLMRELAFGRTNIELRCENCGDIQFRSVVGKS